ncbi:MAG: hypothetical protein MRJ65_01940 [Candidatus Brocadiaceae bacterium]|nr:hypothetical protein [Candidatus Brocadiaceae bacterium]
MAKNRALGNDPLHWLKARKEVETGKAASSGKETVSDATIEKDRKQENVPSATGQQMSQSTPDEKKQVVPEKAEASGTENVVPVGNSGNEPKVVIGRLYEEATVEKARPVQQQTGIFQGERKRAQAFLPVSKTVKTIQDEVSKDVVPSAGRVFPSVTYIVIAYTALLLILGYFVYADLSKRTSAIEARIFALEKALRLK